MFDISFAELMIIMIVGLIVLGPEKLPVVARTIGHLLGRAQRYVEQIKTDLRAEMELDNLRKLQDTVQNDIDTLQDSLNKEISQIQRSVDISSGPSSKKNTDALPDIAQKIAPSAPSAQDIPRQKSTDVESEATVAELTANRNRHDA